MEYDLIIVGLGPVGVTAANLAGQWGLRTLVLDKSESVYQNPRAMGLDHEAMRTFDNIGLADSVAEHVMPYRASHYLNADAKLIKHIDASKPPFLLGWAPNYVFSQPPLERALRANLDSLPQVDVLLGREVLNVESTETGVSISYRDATGSIGRASAKYLLACDGGTSPIRTNLGLNMEDLAFDEPWLVVDVILSEGAGSALPETNVQYCETERPSTFVVGPGRHRRWEFMINGDESPTEIIRPESIQRLISRWLPADDYQIWRASTYRFHALILERWRVGNIFFLGDAAHMTPPFLAQGMCQGLRDAMNLIWKLAFVQRGIASPQLLDSYQTERAPHVKRTTEVAKEFGQTICERDPVRAAERDKRLLAAVQVSPGGTIRQSLIPSLESGFIGLHKVAGVLFPQPKVTTAEQQEDLLDRFTGQSIRLVIADGFTATEALLAAFDDALRGVQLPTSVVQLSATPMANYQYREHNGLLKAWLQEHGCQVVLVRPDHYVYGGASTLDEAVHLIQDCFGRLRS
ncbi:bifunctional 3-(3-hydroxy-phenyl)propionate/3-hydroxycinnamic acid hydroxylase [Pseudomonas sp. Teo4]|uniref:bifunctional 3-(3-hydroxy-phenyl)propionate/3-hydroxycinnamic acid hydroxylase n=1 Tax=Pseudomonas sp. Teo4 TaxID=3064528 RepID=UPI002ABD0B13|nr:bifunctional 3-(3-hydroxy-phenyl)propionate/3-hydroxycinnamic acid hydroxylase [Pseudomonas sp. Teo4]MDZ3992658.1 putative NADH-specific resorcinol 4-hydroxylase [Pseudomonas sp. Teo4]